MFGDPSHFSSGVGVEGDFSSPEAMLDVFLCLGRFSLTLSPPPFALRPSSPRLKGRMEELLRVLLLPLPVLGLADEIPPFVRVFSFSC